MTTAEASQVGAFHLWKRKFWSAHQVEMYMPHSAARGDGRNDVLELSVWLHRVRCRFESLHHTVELGGQFIAWQATVTRNRHNQDRFRHIEYCRCSLLWSMHYGRQRFPLEKRKKLCTDQD